MSLTEVRGRHTAFLSKLLLQKHCPLGQKGMERVQPPDSTVRRQAEKAAQLLTSALPFTSKQRLRRWSQQPMVKPWGLSPACCLWAHSVAQSCLTLCDPVDCSPRVPLSMGFSRQESWSGLPCLPPEDLPDPGMEPESLTSPALAGRLFTTSATGKARFSPDLKPHWGTSKLTLWPQDSYTTETPPHLPVSPLVK